MQIFFDGSLFVGLDDFTLMEYAATGLLLIRDDGFALKVDADMTDNRLAALGISLDASFRIQANTLSENVSYALPEGFPSVDGSRLVSISGAPPVDGDDTEMQSYFMVQADGSLEFLGSFELEGAFKFLFSPQVTEIHLAATLPQLGLLGLNASVDATARLYAFDPDPGLVIDAQVQSGLAAGGVFGISGVLDMNAEMALKINTRNTATMGIQGHFFRIDLDNLEAEFLGLIEMEGAAYVEVDGAILRVGVKELTADFFGVGHISVSGFFNSTGEFALSLEGGVEVGSSDFGIWGRAELAMAYVNQVLSISGSVDAGATLFGFDFSLPDLGFTYDSASGDLKLSVTVEIDLEVETIEKTATFYIGNFKLPHVQLGGNENDPTSFSGGTLYLNMGDRAEYRLFAQDDTVEHFTVMHVDEDVFGNPITSVAGNETVLVVGMGRRQIFSGVSRIVGHGGTDYDFMGTSGILSPVEFYGGDDEEDHVGPASGAYLIHNGSGQAHLVGGAGNDVIQGGSGADEIFGREGNDRLSGGAGNDRFYFTGNYGKDGIDDVEGDNTLLLDETATGVTGYMDTPLPP